MRWSPSQTSVFREVYVQNVFNILYDFQMWWIRKKISPSYAWVNILAKICPVVLMRSNAQPMYWGPVHEQNFPVIYISIMNSIMTSVLFFVQFVQFHQIHYKSERPVDMELVIVQYIYIYTHTHTHTYIYIYTYR